MFSLRVFRSKYVNLLGRRVDALHVEERMEKGVDKSCCKYKKLWHVGLQRSIDEIIVVGRHLEVLLQL